MCFCFACRLVRPFAWTPGFRLALILPALGTLFLGIFPTWVLNFAGKSATLVK